MTRFLAILAALWALVGVSPAHAAGLSLTSLTPHGTPAATDLIPCQPAAGTTMLSCTVSNLGNYVVTNLKAYGAVGDGVTDDTTAIQTAINTGLPLYCPPGVYKTTATLTVSKPANDGQTLRGSGSWGEPDAFNSATGGGACVIRPTSAVTVAIKVDGTSFAGGGVGVSWVQGFGISDLVIDMTSMTDDATHIAINQVQAWDVHYDNVRVINDGSYKRAWLLNGGAFTTALNQPYGHIIDLEGTNASFQVTTVTINNPDVVKIIANYTSGVVVNGGTVQHPYTAGVTPIVWIPAGLGPYSWGTGGVYLAVGTDIKNSSFFTITGTDFEAASQPPTTCAVGGWAGGTYNDGSHGCGKLIMGALVESTALASSVTTPAASGMYFMDQGVGSTFNGLSQNGVAAFGVQGATQYDLGDLRVVGTLSGPVGFGGALGSETSSSYTIVGSTGAATLHTATVKPSSDAAALIVKNSLATTLFDVTTNATAASSAVNIDNGVGLVGYNDNETTLTWNLTDVSNAGKLILYNAGSATITLTGSNGLIQATGLFNTPVGASGANTGAFTTLSASSTVSGTGFSTYLASPPAIGGSAAAAGTFTTLSGTTSVLSTGTGGIGYGTGAGGTVTQATSKSTGVTLNKTTGAITMNGAALAASTSVMFTLTNSTIAATDVVVVDIKSGATTLAYLAGVEAVAAGSANIVIRNVSAGSLSEAVVLNFAVMKGVTS